MFTLPSKNNGCPGNIGCIETKPQRTTSFEICGDATLSDLEFQRELSPEQMREALSLLGSTAGTQNHTVQIEDLHSAEEVNPD